MIRNLNKEDIITIAKKITSITNEELLVLNNGLLHQSVNSPFITFDDTELYPTIENKASQLCFSLLKNHCFQDGNKRIAMMSMLVFLNINGVDVKHFNHEQLYDIIYGVAAGLRPKCDIFLFLHGEFISTHIR